VKLVALYKQPEDTDAFDKAYFDTHMPLIEKVPGLKSTAITRFTRTVAGEEGWYLMAEMDFGDEDTLKAAMRSPEMGAAGENLNSFAEDMYTLLFAQSE
jgi:uncharacterized protein (TIGR02118 family)